MEIKTTKEIELDKLEYSIYKDNTKCKFNTSKKQKYEQIQWIKVEDVETFLKEELQRSGAPIQILEEFYKQIKVQ